MCEKLEIGLKFFFSGQGIIFQKFDLSKRCKNEIQHNTKKYEVELASGSQKKSVIPPMIFTETTRQRWS